MQLIFVSTAHPLRPSRRPNRPHRGVITITGIGDHLRPEWPITITGTRTQDHWPFEADDRLERPAARSPPWLHQLGTVRGEPEADLGERPYAAPDRSQVGPRRPSLADRFGALRPLRPHDAGVLWHAIGPCPPLPL